MKLLVSSVIALILFISACNLSIICEKPEGKIITKQLELETISSIELSENIKVNIVQGDVQEVQIVAPENYAELIKTNVSNGEWNIDFAKCLQQNDQVELFIQLKELEEIEINGSGTVIGMGIISGQNLKMEISGSGTIQLEVENKNIDIEISGSGDIQLSGNTKKQEIEINGSGDVKNTKLVSDESDIQINGSGDVRVNATYKLKVEVNGSGDVYYQGDPKQIKTEFNGSGKLHQLNQGEEL